MRSHHAGLSCDSLLSIVFQSPQCLFNVQMLQVPPKASVSERISFSVLLFVVLVMNDELPKIIGSPLFSSGV